jgi:ABC-type branched-subunit amino acid transport system substrate-binding protein
MKIRALKLMMVGLAAFVLSSCGHKSQPEVTPPPPAPKQTTPPVKAVPLKPEEPKGPKTHKIGLLLPLTGPQSELGQGMLHASEMALFEAGASNVTIVPQDTSGGVQKAVQKALDQGAELILGPIFAGEVQAIKPIARARNVSVVSFSTDHSIAGNGTYILGFLPSQQIETVVKHAKETGLTRIAAFTPEDSYGRLVDQTLRNLSANGSVQLVGITHYVRSDLLEGNPGNARIIEEMANYKSKGVNAILIPEGGENLNYLVTLLQPQLSVKVLGSGQWDTPETRSITGLHGSVFASTDTLERQNFENRYREAYGKTPPRLATIAYDATALAVALSERGYTPQNLTNDQGFAGIDGLFRLTPQGLNERGLAVIEVNATGFRTLNPAPGSF